MPFTRFGPVSISGSSADRDVELGCDAGAGYGRRSGAGSALAGERDKVNGPEEKIRPNEISRKEII